MTEETKIFIERKPLTDIKQFENYIKEETFDYAWEFYKALGYRITDSDEDKIQLEKYMNETFIRKQLHEEALFQKEYSINKKLDDIRKEKDKEIEKLKKDIFNLALANDIVKIIINDIQETYKNVRKM